MHSIPELCVTLSTPRRSLLFPIALVRYLSRLQPANPYPVSGHESRTPDEIIADLAHNLEQPAVDSLDDAAILRMERNVRIQTDVARHNIFYELRNYEILRIEGESLQGVLRDRGLNPLKGTLLEIPSTSLLSPGHRI